MISPHSGGEDREDFYPIPVAYPEQQFTVHDWVNFAICTSGFGFSVAAFCMSLVAINR